MYPSKLKREYNDTCTAGNIVENVHSDFGSMVMSDLILPVSAI